MVRPVRPSSCSVSYWLAMMILSVVAVYVGIGVVIKVVAETMYRMPPAPWPAVLLWPMTVAVVLAGWASRLRP